MSGTMERGSPDPIPNSAAKPAIAQSTATPGRGRTGRSAHGDGFGPQAGKAPDPTRIRAFPRLGANSPILRNRLEAIALL